MRWPRARADGHRGTQLVDGRTHLAVVAACRIGGRREERRVQRAVESFRRLTGGVEGHPQHLHLPLQ